MNRVETFDIIVIGSGGGVKVALPCAAAGLKTALIERDACGGTCLNRGCIPSKMLIYPCEQVVRMRRSAGLNIRGAQDASVDFSALVRRTSETVDAMSAGLEKRFSNNPPLELIKGSAGFVGNRTICVNGRLLSAPQIIIATGSRPMVPDIPGLAETPFMTSREALRCEKLPRKLLVIGGGYIAVELGFVYATAGSDVTFLVRSRLLRKEDPEIAAEFSREFTRHHNVLEGVDFLSVDHSSGVFTVEALDAAGKQLSLKADGLLVAAGVVPETVDLALDNAGINTTEDGYIAVDDFMETTVPGIYAIGDVAGKYLFRHTVNYEGEYLERLLKAKAARVPLDYGPVPHAVYSSPEVAGVGLTEPEARAAGYDCITGVARYAESNPGAARGLEHGICKLIFDRASQRLLGAHICGEEAAAIVHMLIVAMKNRATLNDLRDIIVIHPALPEVVRDAWRGVRG